MKCRNCGINFYDEDKACPMCGTRAYGNKQRKGVRPTILNGQAVGGTSPRKVRQQPSGIPRPVSGTPRPVRGGRPAPRKKSGAFSWIIVLVILSQLGSALFSGDTGIRIQQRLTDFWAEMQSDPGQRTPEPDYPNYIIPQSLLGDWDAARDDGVIMRLRLQADGNYLLHEAGAGWSVKENGHYTVTPESADAPRADGLPPQEDFAAYHLALSTQGREISGTDVPQHWKQRARTYLLTLYEDRFRDDGTLIAVDDEGVLLPSGAEVLQRIEG